MEPLSAISVVILFALIGLVAVVMERLVRLPFSLWLVLLGFLFALMLPWLNWDTGVRADNFQSLILFVLLPVLVFEAAYNLNLTLLRQFLPTILLLAVGGMMLSTFVIAGLVFVGIGHPVGFPWIAALLVGAILSATDPVAVVDQLQRLQAPKALATLIEGESLFNDATAIIAFTIILGIATGEREWALDSAVANFFIVSCGGAAIGALSVAIFYLLLRWVTLTPHQLNLAMLVLAYGTFYLAEHQWHVSGVVAVLVCAIVSKLIVERTNKQWHEQVVDTWHFISFLANIFVFVLLGLVITLEMFAERWLAMLIGIAATLVARTLVVYLCTWCLNGLNRKPVEARYRPIMVWGGLRGAITIGLALSLPTSLDYWWTIQSIAFGVVLFTLVVQAPTNGLLMRRLGLVGK